MLPLVPRSDCDVINTCATTVIPPFYHLLSLLGTLGNLYSLWGCLRPSQPWSIGTIWVLNLAMCDLVYLASMPPWAVYLSTNYQWDLSHSVCILVNVLYFIGLTTNTMFICTISTDRFLAIAFPLESRMVRTPRNAVLVSVLLWAIAALLVYLQYPNILYWEHHDGTKYCGVLVISKLHVHRAAYSLLSYHIVQVSIPFLLVIPSYVRIMVRMRQSRQQWSMGTMQARDRTMWLIAVFIANFLISWVPGKLLYIISFVLFITMYESANPCWLASVINLLMEASQVLYCVNACLDPLIFHVHQGLGEQCQAALSWMVCWGKERMWSMEEKESRTTPAVMPISVVQLQGPGHNQATFLKQ
ncbi:type-1 angiotensin II receptor-like [Scleropages formosus]|uniref:Type-1 angiotensin II receptor-like n=2 Tax=Scleropages formosus TaxID=113540 RepID=A0A0P7W9F0_SCLFO|nr:type-1 angiotensin II receptor-like [Scleropages formosus]